MQERVLVATDLTEAGTGALRRAAWEATQREASLTVMHCVEVAGDRDRWRQLVRQSPFQTSQIRTEAFGRLDEQFTEAVDEDARPTHTEYHVDVGRPADRIRATADEKNADVIVLGGSDGTAVERLLLGSVSEEVVRSASRPVMVVPSDVTVGPVEAVLSPVDFSECSRASLRESARWAQRVGARLEVLHVLTPEGPVPPFSFGREVGDSGEIRERATAKLEELVAEVVPGELEVELLVEEGPPANAIRAVADERRPDLVVMGTHGRRGLEQFIVGSTALEVLRQARWPVVTIRDRHS